MSKNPFSTFTNLYPVQKTLRRELKALNADLQTDASLTALWAAEIPSQDQQREADYQAIKPLLDELHHQFISESLQTLPVQNWSDFVSFYQDYQQKKKRKADLDEKTIKTLDEDFKTRT